MYFPQVELWSCFPTNENISNSSVEGQMIDGAPVGYWTYYRENGNPYIITKWQAKCPIKSWTFYSNGKIKHFVTFDSDGVMKVKHFDNIYSTLVSELTIKDGHVRGQLKKYYPNGQLKAEGQVEKTYDINGNLTTTTFIKSGLWKFYDEEDNLTHELTFKEGSIDGYCRYYDDEGHIYADGKQIDEDRIGLWRLYHRDDNEYELYVINYGSA